jgi:UMF1 family MFS transporter
MRKEIQKVSPQKKDQIEDVEAGALKMLRVPWLFDREDSLLDEVIAWIWYDVANSNYSSVSMATFLPLLLNSYATTIAWERSGEDAPPYCSDLESKYSEACIECRVGEGDLLCTGSGTGRTNCDTLDVPTIGGLAPSSFAFFIISMSCISQLLSFMVWGQSGDYSDNRRLYLMISSVIGAASLICFAFFPVGEAYAKHIIAAILTITCNTSFGLAQIFYNAYLPLITDDLAEALPDDNHADIENKVSSYAMAGGYYSGVLGLLVSVAIIIAAGGTEEGASEYVVASAFRWCVVWSGLFWLVGSFLTIPRLGNRPGKDGAGLPWYHTAQAFWRTISWTYTELPVTFRYLVLYFLYSDGFSTISGLGLIYVRLDMCATTSQVRAANLALTFPLFLDHLVMHWPRLISYCLLPLLS